MSQDEISASRRLLEHILNVVVESRKRLQASQRTLKSSGALLTRSSEALEQSQRRNPPPAGRRES